MVYIVSGPRDSGKSTKIKELFNKAGAGAWGFCGEKIKEGNRIIGYNLLNLRTGNTQPLARLSSEVRLPGREDTCTHGIFTFYRQGFQSARNILHAALQNNAESFFIDEVGRMELTGGGHAALLREAVKHELNLCIAIRDINVKAALREFALEPCTIIDIPAAQRQKTTDTP